MPRSPSDPILRAQAAENFPVASRLLAAPLRPVVHAFYRVVRGADDIADAPALTREAKQSALRALDAVLAGTAPAAATPLELDGEALRAICMRHAYDIDHARQLLQAFLADAANRPCRSWSDLIAYCRFSAVPVGRFLLDLHGEKAAAQRASDALCTALQILNHLQDCKRDWLELQRCYIPTGWLDAEGSSPAALGAPRADGALRRVLDRMLDHVEPLLVEARTLARTLDDRRLAREAAGICALADDLARRLRRQDPLRERVAPGKLAKAAIFLRAAATLRPQRSRRGGSSFRIAIRFFPAAARRAVAAIYALARRLDDIADGPAPPARKLAAMAAWRTEIAALYAGRPEDALTRALLPWTASLPQRELLALIDGLEGDAAAAVHAPSDAEFALYCRRVAGTVGVLVLAACGRTSAADEHYAMALGEALQRVNVLRDIDEDGREGRLYLPAEILAHAGLDPRQPVEAILRDPRMATARALFVASVDEAFRAADAARAAAGGAPAIAAVRAIAAIYRRLFERLRRSSGAPVRLDWRDHGLALLAMLRAS